VPDGPFTVELADGRVLEGWTAGAAAEAVLLHMGTPSAGIPFEPVVAEVTRRGLRFVTYSRPGYAGSTRKEARTVAGCVEDVVPIADALGVERIHAVGWSGGGPHALACAALLPDLVAGAATLGEPRRVRRRPRAPGRPA
jgi:pimeloyl-ACP methyl ester carboxylesterase